MEKSAGTGNSCDGDEVGITWGVGGHVGWDTEGVGGERRVRRDEVRWVEVR